MSFRKTGALILAGIGLVLAACSNPTVPAPPVTTVPTIVVPTATPSGTVITYQVQRGEVVDMVQMRGRVAAAVDQDVFFTDTGYIKELYVERNAAVAAGQLLAELDLGDLADQLTRAQADLSSLQQLVSSSNQQRNYAVQSARIGLQNAQDRLAQLQAPPTQDKFEQAQAEIERARLNLENTRNTTSAAKTNAGLAVDRAANAVRNAQDAYSRIVWENGNLPLDQLSPEQRNRQEQAERAIADAEIALSQARVNYDLTVQQEQSAVALADRELRDAEQALVDLNAPPDPFALREAERVVQQARINLSQAIANSGSPEMQGRIEDVRQTIGELEDKIAAGKLYAPFDGVVAEIGVKPGDLVEAYVPVINIINPERLNLVISEISGEDLARMAPGQELEIVFDRYPDSVFAGSVEQLPSDQVSAGSLVRPNRLLRIAFDAGDRELTVGDPAMASLVFNRISDALWLPPQAIYRFDNRTFVLVRDESGERPVDVTIGVSTPERVEILAGIQAGDTVVVNDSAIR